MLALAQREVERRGGEVAYCDTDSLAVVATKDGGFVPCEGGPYRLADGSRGLRALSWDASGGDSRTVYCAQSVRSRDRSRHGAQARRRKLHRRDARRAGASYSATRFPKSSMRSLRSTREASRSSASIPRTSLGSTVRRFRAIATAGLSTRGSARFARRLASPSSRSLGSSIRQSRSLRLRRGTSLSRIAKTSACARLTSSRSASSTEARSTSRSRRSQGWSDAARTRGPDARSFPTWHNGASRIGAAYAAGRRGTSRSGHA